MIELSSKTQVNRRFRLTELYKTMPAADRKVKADGKNIQSIVLTNVISSDTVNLPSNGTVKEVYIFKITLIDRQIPSLFISALDKNINLHTVFILEYNEECMLYGCFKERTEKGVKLGKYYSTNWKKNPTPITLPLTVTSIDDIYKAIIEQLIPIKTRIDESTADFVMRYEKIVKLTKDIEKLQKAVDNERQPKHRFELNDELKKHKKELQDLYEKGEE